MSGEKISIIYPPPELRNIVDKTASFVARNGPEFESKIQQNESNNPKFNFLKIGDPYHAYYQFKVKEFKEGGGQQNGDASKKEQQQKQAAETNGKDAKVAESEEDKQMKQLTSRLENIWAAPVIIREPPPPFEFSADPPTLAAYDLDLVKLTAQFVAVHGRSFLTNLMTREARNYQFDFLRPQHGLFQYFTSLIEQYSKILMPPKNICAELEKDLTDYRSVVNKLRYRAEFTRISQAKKEKEEEEAERERLAYAQIDWHDFVIVETVDFQPNETGNFALPTTPDQVGSRLLLQERLETVADPSEIEMVAEVDINPEELAKEPEPPKNIPPPPLPPSLDNVLIRRDYDPKAKSSSGPQSNKSLPDNWVISPITGEKIPAQKVQEHMRYNLLDPRWVEQRDRHVQEKMQQDEVFAPGASIETSLRQLAERRTDIFGHGPEETHIGRKIGEDREPKKPESTIWDGYTSSKEAVAKAARANINVEEQIQQIQRAKGLLADPDKEKIGPAPMGQSRNNQPNLMPPRMPPQIPQQSMLNPGIPLLPNPLLQPHPGSYNMPPPHPLGVPVGMYGMPPPPMGYPPHHPMDMEPSYKRMRTEDNLIPEQDFLASCPPQVNVVVQCPQSDDKPEWKLHGQMLNITLRYADTFATLKTRIAELTNMPQNKQKLQFEGIFVKDTNTMAYYNIPQGACIVLGFKERGGRKK